MGCDSQTLVMMNTWREGYDYPEDDYEQDERDMLDRADDAYEQLNDI